MRRLPLAALLCVLPAGTSVGEDRPIPQNPERQQQRSRDRLAANRRTLVGAYDKIGKKDPRWDGPARMALEGAARMYSDQADPPTKPEEVYTAARRAVDAGCDDPLVLYTYARVSRTQKGLGPAESDQRWKVAATAMEHSAYPPFRRAIALYRFGLHRAARKDLSPEDREEGKRALDAALALFPKSVAEDEHTPDWEICWFEAFMATIGGYRDLDKIDPQVAIGRVDAVLARVPSMKAMRLNVRGQYLIESAWEARGDGFADTVTEEGSRKLGERLTGAKKALEESWRLKPGEARPAALMLIVVKGLGGDRDEMEKWFARAIQADGDNLQACSAKLDYLDPKWHGTIKDTLAFGRACRATKNWRAGLTVLLAEAHLRVAASLEDADQKVYYRSAGVWADIKGVYDEYLAHFPDANGQRSMYASLCYQWGHFAEADEQFRKLGENLIPSPFFTMTALKEMRESSALQVEIERENRSGSASGASPK